MSEEQDALSREIVEGFGTGYVTVDSVQAADCRLRVKLPEGRWKSLATTPRRLTMAEMTERYFQSMGCAPSEGEPSYVMVESSRELPTNDRVDLISDAELTLIVERDKARDLVRVLQARVYNAEGRVRELEARGLAVAEPGGHDYHGPLDADRKPVPDPTHEQFHRAVGDVMAGKVIPKAREQMERALAGQKARDAAAPKPFPVRAFLS